MPVWYWYPLLQKQLTEPIRLCKNLIVHNPLYDCNSCAWKTEHWFWTCQWDAYRPPVYWRILEGGVGPPHVTYPMHFMSPPPRVGQTDACENLTFARYATRALNIYPHLRLLRLGRCTCIWPHIAKTDNHLVLNVKYFIVARWIRWKVKTITIMSWFPLTNFMTFPVILF